MFCTIDFCEYEIARYCCSEKIYASCYGSQFDLIWVVSYLINLKELQSGSSFVHYFVRLMVPQLIATMYSFKLLRLALSKSLRVFLKFRPVHVLPAKALYIKTPVLQATSPQNSYLDRNTSAPPVISILFDHNLWNRFCQENTPTRDVVNENWFWSTYPFRLWRLVVGLLCPSFKAFQRNTWRSGGRVWLPQTTALTKQHLNIRTPATDISDANMFWR